MLVISYIILFFLIKTSENCVLTSTEVKELEPSCLSSMLYSGTPLTSDLENFNIQNWDIVVWIERTDMDSQDHFSVNSLTFAILTCAFLKPCDYQVQAFWSICSFGRGTGSR